MLNEFLRERNLRSDSKGLQFEYRDSKYTVTSPDATRKNQFQLRV